MHGCLRREQSGSSCEPAWWGCPEHAGQVGGPRAEEERAESPAVYPRHFQKQKAI